MIPPSRAAVLLCAGWLSACGSADPVADRGAAPSGEAAAHADPFDADPFFLDERLAWEGPRYGTLGPTGRRLWADVMESAPGLRGTFAYLHRTEDGPVVADPIALDVEATVEGDANAGAAGDETFAPAALEETWHPSFHECRYALGPVSVRERRFVSDDDVALVVATFTNGGTAPARVQCRVRSGAARDPLLDEGALHPVDLGLFANLERPPIDVPASAARGDALPLIRVEGVPFLLRRPGSADPRVGVALKGGREGEAAALRPAFVEIPITTPARRLHLLGQIALDAGRVPDGATVARYRLVYDDGVKSEDLVLGRNLARPDGVGGLPGLRGRNGRFVLVLPVDATRRLRYLRFEKVATVASPVLLALTVEESGVRAVEPALAGRGTFFGVDAEAALAGRVVRDGRPEPLGVTGWTGDALSLAGGMLLAPGTSGEVRLAFAMCDAAANGGSAAALARARRWLDAADPLLDHRTEWHGWFERNCPRFASGDPLLDTLWWYRWFVVRHALAVPDAGNLRGPVFFPGRHGTWNARLASDATPHVIAETRWLADPSYARNQIRQHLANADEHGLLQSARTDWTGAFYTHWIARAAMDLDEVHPDRAFLEEVVNGLAADVEATLALLDEDGDFLPAPPNHYATGMEFQPSFFWSQGFDVTRLVVKLERPDFAAYLFANASALAEAARRIGDEARARRMAEVAAAARAAVLETCWDARERLFLSVREEDDARVPVAEIVAFYPFAFGVVPDEALYGEAFQRLFSPADFNTPVPFATCSRAVPAFTPHVDPGAGLRWNGPVWPPANSVVARALGETLRAEAGAETSLSPAHLRRFLEAYARMHFEEGDLARPLLRESADAETGAMAGCPDAFRSTWIDLVMRYGELVGWPKPWYP